ERGLVACHVRLIDKVYPAQPLDVDVSLPARHNETQRISLLRSQGFAVLPICHDDVIERFRKRQAAGKTRRVGTFGDQPARLGPWTHLIEQSLERYAGPLRATQQSVAHLRISAWLPELIARRVTRAFEKVDVRDRRKPENVLHGEDQRSFHQAVNHQLVVVRIDLRNTGMVSLEMQRRWSDDTMQILKRCTTGAGSRSRRRLEVAC